MSHREVRSTAPVRVAVVGLVVVAGLHLGCAGPDSPVRPTPPSVPPAGAPTQEYRLSGKVVDTAYRPLAGSRVEAVEGSRAGTVVTTDEAGRFSMPGLFTGTTMVRASKDGYAPDTNTVPFHGAPLPPAVEAVEMQLYLQPLGPSADLAGVYILTLTADSACTSLPNEARMRNYTATIVPIPGSGTSFRATLSDARFFSTYNRALIATAGDFAYFSLCISDPSQSYCFPGIVEQLRETTYVAIEGGAEGVFDAAGITARFAGSFQYCPSETGLTGNQYECLASARIQCESHNHQLTLIRR